MRIKLVSDIHTEFDRDAGDRFLNSIPNDGVDVLVVAGDLTTKYHEENLTLLCDRFPNVIYVAGNHDYWKSSISERNDLLTLLQSKLPNLHWLNNNRIILDGQGFVGATMWFPRINRPTNSGWVDFRFVADGANGIFNEHEISRKFFLENVQKDDIVVTHHLPCQEAVADKWREEPSNCYFVSDVDEIVHSNRPKMWFFGHTHDFRHLSVGDTELFCNPRGYPHEGVDYHPDLIIDTSI